MSEAQDRVEALLRDIRESRAPLHEIVQGVRMIVREVAPQAGETVMYGGIMFAADAPVCGVYAYKQHVSLEFGRGCDLEDAHGVLEGGGKLRRHIKLESAADLEGRHVREYVARAFENAEGKGARD